MIPLDADYMEARPARRAAALVREVAPVRLPDVLTGPGFGLSRWEATPRGDGTFGVRKVGLGIALLSGCFTTEAEAQAEADSLNTKGDA